MKTILKMASATSTGVILDQLSYFYFSDNVITFAALVKKEIVNEPFKSKW